MRIGVLLSLLLPAQAFAAGDWGPEELGGEPTYVFEGPYELVATGAPMVQCVPGDPRMGVASACSGIDNQRWNVGGFPDGGRFEAAWLVWTHSRDPEDPIDSSITLTLPNAAPVQLQADAEEECVFYNDVLRGDTADLLGIAGEELSWATCRHDVAALMNQHLDAGGSINGRWEAEGLEIADDRPILIGGIAEANLWHIVSAVVGSVVFVGILTPDVATPHRKIYLYQGFRFIEGPATFDIEIEGFLAPPDPNASVLIHMLEGDVALQGDQLRFNGDPLSDDCNPQGNVWNGTVNVGRADGGCLRDAEGTDLDLYDVGHLIQHRDTSATLRLVVPAEQIFSNFIAIQFDSVPEFIKPSMGSEPRINTPVSLGQTITYQINVLIGGDGDATDVVITDELPAGTRYVAGSATIDGEPVPHPNGQGSLPLQTGLPVTEILGRSLARGDQHVISFEVCAIAAPPNGQFVNVATLKAQGIEAKSTNQVVHPYSGEGAASLCDGVGPGEGGGADEGQADEGADEGAQGEADVVAEGGEDGEGHEGQPDNQRAEGDEGVGEGEGGAACGPGTHRDGASGQCVPDCGEGTYFDEVSGLCKTGNPPNAGGTNPPRRGGGCNCNVGQADFLSQIGLLLRR